MSSQFDTEIAQIRLLLNVEGRTENEKAAFLKKAITKTIALLDRLENDNEYETARATFDRLKVPHFSMPHQNRQRRVRRSAYKINLGDVNLHFDAHGHFLAVEAVYSSRIDTKETYEAQNNSRE